MVGVHHCACFWRMFYCTKYCPALAACLAWPAYIVKDGVAGISSDLHACFRSLGAIPPGAGVPPEGLRGSEASKEPPTGR